MDGPGYTSASSASAHTATSHRRKLIKKPPSYFGRSSSGFDGGAFDAQSLESKRSSQSLKRAPSAPPARSNPATVSDWQDSDRSHPQLSANNTLRPVPSPISHHPSSPQLPICTRTYSKLRQHHHAPVGSRLCRQHPTGASLTDPRWGRFPLQRLVGLCALSGLSGRGLRLPSSLACASNPPLGL